MTSPIHPTKSFLDTGRRVMTLAVAVGVLGLAACASSPSEEINTEASIEALYRSAKEEGANGKYETAVRLFERLEGRAAGSVLAQQAQLEIAHLHFRNRERALALSSIERFIKLNPSSPALDYAMYLRGVINFNDDLGFLGGLAKRDLSERDQQASRDAYQSFKLLVDQFPNSPYSADARVRMDYIVNALAEYEVHVAKYYYRRGAYLAAANRAQFAVTEYPQAPALEEALNLMSLSYDQLGLTQLRDDARRVLAKSFPQSRYLKGDAGIGERSGWRLW